MTLDFAVKKLAIIFLLAIFLIKQSFAFRNGCLLENDKSSIYISIPENRTSGSLLTTLPLLGRTAEDGSGDIALRLVHGSQYAVLNSLNKKLMLNKAIDRDTGMTKLEVVVECTPLGRDKQPQVNITTFVTVTDINDNAPQFAEPEFFVELPEELPLGITVAVDLQAVDMDQEGPNNFITYSLLPPKGGGQLLLAIPDPHTPQLVVAGRVDFENIQSFLVDVQAEDSGHPALKSQTRVHVQVVDVDDLNPYFEHQIYTANSVLDSVVQVRPQPILARDPDTFHQPIVYWLGGEDDNQKFSIDEKTGVVWFSGVPSSLPNSHTLVVHAAQVDRPERNASAVLLITNSNASSPPNTVNQVPQDSYFIQLPSNCPKGRQVLQLQGSNGTIYKLQEDSQQSSFQLSDKGKLSVNGLLQHPKYTLTVVDNSQKKITVNINVYPSLVTGPEFGEQEYVFEVEPLEPIVGRVQAHSYAPKQLGDDASLFYSLLTRNGGYELDADGVLTIKREPKKQVTAEMQELIGMVEDVQGRRNFVRILIKPTNTRLEISCLALLCFASILVNLVMCTAVFGKKAVDIYQASRRGCSAGDWMGACPPGVTITSPISTSDMDAFATCYRSNKF